MPLRRSSFPVIAAPAPRADHSGVKLGRERFNREGTKDAKISLLFNPIEPWRSLRLSVSIRIFQMKFPVRNLKDGR